ncbi:TPA: virB8 family protein [Legionella pneumophila]
MSKNQSYFKQACDWADDKFGLLEASRARYRVAFYVAMSATVSLSIALACLAPLKQVQTIAVHHYQNGVTTVEAESANVATINKAQIESDIVRYIINRESFDDSSYRAQFELVQLLSNDTVAREFETEQSASNLDAPINTLGTAYTRSVHVYSINFIDNENLNSKERKAKQNHHNLAEVVFSVKDHEKAANRDQEKQYTALVSWRYVKPSDSIEERWKNFDGFEITRYTKSQRNV